MNKNKKLAVRLFKCQGYRMDGPSVYEDSIGQWILIQIIRRRNNKTNKGRVVMTSSEHSSGNLPYARKKAQALAKELNIPYVEVSEWWE